MTKTIIRYRKYFITALLVAVLVTSFIPFNRFEVYSGAKDAITGRPIYTYEYRSFFIRLFHYITDVRYESFLFASCIIIFYLATLLSLLYLLFNKRIRFLIALLLNVVCMITLAFTGSYISMYSLVVAVICFVLMLLDLLLFIIWNDKTKKKEIAIKRAENEKIAQTIRTKRKECGLTQKDLAEKAFISRSLLSKIESGSVTIGDNHLKNIAIALGVDVNCFKNADSGEDQSNSKTSYNEMKSV